ncbi:non-ribosomal peptide synthetase, partial [Calothrix rhizosoleniae]|uniref:non-ribosomal peptide synthetase n=1 Tax=Calothrix rhizosoleniae TaxID=888997 RepID=UPI001177CDE5
LTLKAYENQDVPFEQVVEALQPQRDLSYSPLFQVGFSLENAPLSEVELTGITLSQLEQESTTAKFDLTLSISETDQGLVGKWEYNTDLFNDSTIERMIQHFQNLLQGIVEKPEQNISLFTLISKEERHQLLVEWNDTATDYPSNKCIHQLFEQQVEENPNDLAVVFGEQQLTYQQLNQRANQLAYHLQSLGIKPEVLVGICVERNLEMVVGLLGILKAGGAYVPLDPNYPQERLSYMLADSGVGVLVTQSSLLESLPQNNARVVCLDSDWGLISQESQENFDAGVNSDNLAYVIYTSGSTGKPKGVAIEHHSVCNLAQAQTNIFDVTATSNVLQFASFSFDASVWEILMAFTRGATLILGTPSQLMPGDDLKQMLHDYSITHVTLPPSALTVLPTEELPQLANIIVAGEACPLELASKWSVGRRFFNAYGPTESTVCATATQINPSTQKITIGRPIANTQIYILDSNLQPLPIGVPGELYIGGHSLARGYLNQPELTSDKFIPSPFDKSKLYKTGDLARYLTDGNIEFLGRIDNQVKIRGFRIELGEIEAVLSRHPQVNQAVVITTEENIGNKRLVAYVVANSSFTTQQLREYLKAQLSDYMVPSAFVTLDSLPLIPNGKIDRKALPVPETEKNTEYIAPGTQREKILANIFAQVLNVENIGIDDNFFDLGGHSLLATQLISRVKSAFSVEIPLRILFESPTVSQLDHTLNQLGNTKTLPSIQPRSHHQELPLSWAQQRLWFLNELEGKSATYNISTAVRISGNLDINALQKTLSSIV